MPFDDKNTKKYNSKNLPFKSSSCFVIPFCIGDRTKINAVKEQFEKYDINSRVFYMNPDLKKHLTRSDDTILEVFEKKLDNDNVEIVDPKSFYFLL